MGLLDDAIREHLDLKRRRGADPSEVARMEQEALGPVRREPVAVEDHADEGHEPPHPSDEGRHADDAVHPLASEDRHDPPHGDPLHEQRAGDPAPVAADEPQLGGAAAPEPHDAHGEPPADAAEDPLDQPTTEYRVEDHHDDDEHDHAPAPEPARDGPGEDVLEETPDFLQETPEHDRLWFEQRPPRDFDFDG